MEHRNTLDQGDANARQADATSVVVEKTEVYAIADVDVPEIVRI